MDSRKELHASLVIAAMALEAKLACHRQTEAAYRFPHSPANLLGKPSPESHWRFGIGDQRRVEEACRSQRSFGRPWSLGASPRNITLNEDRCGVGDLRSNHPTRWRHCQGARVDLRGKYREAHQRGAK